MQQGLSCTHILLAKIRHVGLPTLKGGEVSSSYTPRLERNYVSVPSGKVCADVFKIEGETTIPIKEEWTPLQSTRSVPNYFL